MKPRTTPSGNQEHSLASAERELAQRQKGYRERALKLFPWICGHCGREFEGKKVADLTVHHKDHNHDHNPPDGSNWELLCLYCHDNEHSRDQAAEWAQGATKSGVRSEAAATFSPFAGLAGLLAKKK